MPWNVGTKMEIKQEFIALAQKEDSNISTLCKQMGISRKTGYKWLKRHSEAGDVGLSEQSRRPNSSPKSTPSEMVKLVCKVRAEHPKWGAKKIYHFLNNHGHLNLPAPSTINKIFFQEGLINPEDSAKGQRYIRFEHEHPNSLWQADYKGHFALEKGRCHPLTIIDDYSRFVISLMGCASENGKDTEIHMINKFKKYGMPERMNFDNGPPWGTSTAKFKLTYFTVWLIKLGIKVSFSTPGHPETNGKIERFHRTLKSELLSTSHYKDLEQAQIGFDKWLPIYNLQRPHEALNNKPPITRYKPSPRPYTGELKEPEYWPGDIIIKVRSDGNFTYKGQRIYCTEALRGQSIGLRETNTDGIYSMYFFTRKLGELSLRAGDS